MRYIIDCTKQSSWVSPFCHQLGLGLHRMSISQSDKGLLVLPRAIPIDNKMNIIMWVDTILGDNNKNKSQISLWKRTRNGGTDQAKSAMEKIALEWYFTTQGHRFRRIKNGPNSSSCITFLPNHHCPKMDSDPAYHECVWILSNGRDVVFGTHRQHGAIVVAEHYHWPLWAFWTYSNIFKR